MNLQPKPFAAIKEGRKVIESRLFDEKKQKIQIGDQIRFCNIESPEDCVTTVVKKLHPAKTFSELFRAFSPEEFGGTSVQELEDQIYQFYSKEDEEKFGVLGIRIFLN